MFKLAFNNIITHKLRMALTVLSIVIGVGFVAGTYMFTDSMRSTFDGIFSHIFDSVDLTIRGKQSDFAEGNVTISSDILKPISKIDGVQHAEAEITGFAQIINSNGDPVGQIGPPPLGFSWTKNSELNPLQIKPGNGRPPKNSGEVAIDINTAKNNNLKVGDEVSIQTALPVEKFKIVGLLSFGEADSLAGATISAFSFSEAQRVFDVGSQISQISLLFNKNADKIMLKEQIDALLPAGVESITGDQQKSEMSDKLNEGLGFITTALLAFAGISIFVGAFIIQNTFRIIVAQRSKELALLRAIGATKRQVVKMVVFEAIIISIVSSVLGIFAGVGVSSGLKAISKVVGLGLPDGPLSLLPRTIAISMGVGIFITILSALFPAIKASGVSPVEAMHDTEQASARKSLKLRAVFGMVLTALGTGAIATGLFTSFLNPLAIVGIGVGVMFIGVAIFAPLIAVPIAHGLGYLLILRYGLIGRIARENTKNSPRRSSATAAALMIGVSLVVFVSIFASSIKSTIDQVFFQNFPGDITVLSKAAQINPTGATFPDSIATEVEQLPEVELVSRFKYDYVKIDGKPVLIVAIQPSTFDSVYRAHPSGGSYDKLGLDNVYINESKLKKLGKNIGDVVEFEYAKTGAKQLKITGSFTEAFDSPYLISDKTYKNNFVNTQDLYFVANISKNVEFTEGRAAINKILDKYPILKAQDGDELIAQTRKQIDQMLGLMSALLGFAIIIAVLGITNTLTLSVLERTREIGMLRAIGMTRSQVRKMIRAEAVIIAVFGAILGVIMGMFFGWVILQALKDIGFTVFSVPYIQIATYLIISALAGVFAAILPSIKASKMNILNAINYE